MDEIQKIEDEKAKFQNIIDNGKAVQKMRAKAELAQLLAADTLPLNKALITAEAKVRAAQKSKDVTAMGKTWWMGRELSEAKKYKPKGGIDKKRFSISN